jgi:hypothetical protein
MGRGVRPVSAYHSRCSCRRGRTSSPHRSYKSPLKVIRYISINLEQSFPSPHSLAEFAFDNRCPDWIPRRYELQPEYGAGETESEYSGLPNDNNTQAWDSLIQRSPTHCDVSRSPLY